MTYDDSVARDKEPTEKERLHSWLKDTDARLTESQLRVEKELARLVDMKNDIDHAHAAVRAALLSINEPRPEMAERPY